MCRTFSDFKDGRVVQIRSLGVLIGRGIEPVLQYLDVYMSFNTGLNF